MEGKKSIVDVAVLQAATNDSVIEHPTIASKLACTSLFQIYCSQNLYHFRILSTPDCRYINVVAIFLPCIRRFLWNYQFTTFFMYKCISAYSAQKFVRIQSVRILKGNENILFQKNRAFTCQLIIVCYSYGMKMLTHLMFRHLIQIQNLMLY